LITASGALSAEEAMAAAATEGESLHGYAGVCQEGAG